MQYGLESFYLITTKFIIILLISIPLHLIKELLIFSLFYMGIKKTSFGLHANSSKQCLIMSTILLLLIPYLCKITEFNSYHIMILGSISSTMFLLYSPADTHKKPLVSKKRRDIFKYISSMICVIYVITALYINNSFIINCLVYSVVIQSFFILPFAYKLFKQPYANYNLYKEVGD